MTDTDVLESFSNGSKTAKEKTATTFADKANNSITKVELSSHNAVDLHTLNIPQLRTLAVEAGIEGTSHKRKSEIISAIEQALSGEGNTPKKTKVSGTRKSKSTSVPKTKADSQDLGEQLSLNGESTQDTQIEQLSTPEVKTDNPELTRESEISSKAAQSSNNNGRAGRKNNSHKGQKSKNDFTRSDQAQKNKDTQGSAETTVSQVNSDNQETEDEASRRRGRRFRERRRGRERGERNGNVVTTENNSERNANESEQTQVVAGILDVLDNYAFLRTTGYLPGPSDVYVSMNMVRRYGLKRGDHLSGTIKVPKESDNQPGRQKFNPLVKVDAINGKNPEINRNRTDFSKLVPLYPNERLRLETQPHILTTRVIDLIMPIGKGQRALIVSPPKAGKTTVLQDMANAIVTNNPECYLMVVLVDERPEEVTDMQRSVKGEIISSTFDRPPSDHTAVAELAIERAKRLVEDGEDVVVLLDSITRLGRAYNNSTPASGRILSGGVDSTALYPPKRFLGAARNIEGGGSLTIIATAMVETGSTGDTVIFEEFKGTSNAELKLDRKIAERRVFPAVDVNPSSTRKDELLLSAEEANIVHKLRRVLSGLDSHQAIDLLISQLKKTRNNVEFLLSVNKSTPSLADEKE